MSETASISYLEAFKLKARNWANNVVKLVNTPATGALAEEKASLLKFANYIKKGIESIFGTIDELENVGLGIAFVIPLAVVAASLAAIAKWTYDYNKFMAKITEQKRLEARGVDPVTAANIIAKKNEPGFFSLNAKVLLPIAVIGGFLWYMRGKK